jgi:predicted O-linked N-acetylglucosamine transferase (SPINDLY family)
LTGAFDLAAPDWEVAWRLGEQLRADNRPEAALACCRDALRLHPRRHELHALAGAALVDLDRFDEAAACYARALKLAPDSADCHYAMAQIEVRRGRLVEAERDFRGVLVIDPGHRAARSGLLVSMLYADSDPREVLAEARAWGARHAASGGHPVAHPNDPSPDRPLRIGYVTNTVNSFRPVGLFLRPILNGHDGDKFACACYITGKDERRIGPLPARSVRQRLVKNLSDEALIRRIRQDGIDILVDIVGHFSDSRLAIFGRRPAPVQVSYLGYPGTTGVDAISYRITDAIADPPGWTENLHTEELIRLPDVFLCYQPPVEMPPVGELPCLRAGHVTFGCFNKLSKISPQAIDAWSQILRQVPGSRLLLHHAWVPGEESKETQRAMIRDFSRNGIRRERLEIAGYLPAEEHLALFGRVDLALDPFPYCGTTTTCELLWMGLPVITVAGRTHVARVGASLMSSVGLSECVANSVDEYVAKAVEMARDRARLQTVRAGMRERMQPSPLMDAPRFVRNLEAAYRHMWRLWCKARRPADSRRPARAASSGGLHRAPQTPC